MTIAVDSDQKELISDKDKKTPVSTIILALLAVVIIGAVIYFLARDNQGKKAPVSQEGTMLQEVPQSQDAGKLADAFRYKKALNCNIVDQKNNQNYQIMANDGFTQMKLTSHSDQGTDYTLFIDGVLYIWTDYDDTAVKITTATENAQLMNNLEEQLAPEDTLVETNNQGEPLVESECYPTENMVFELPEGIEFVDLGEVQGSETSQAETN